jgi:hypothetical protein
MNDNASDPEFEASLRAGLGTAETPDFDAWQARHAEAVAYLNPVVTELKRRKRRLFMRMATAVVAAAVCLVALWFFIPEKASFADAVKRIDSAKSITWTQTTYIRERSKDGQRTWLRVMRRTFAYQEPGLWRMTDYEDAGNPTFVNIADSRSGRTLGLNLKEKKSVDWSPQLFVRFHPRGPFGWVADALEREPLEFIGQRNVKKKTVNVFRLHRDKMPNPPGIDIWIDPQSKEVVGVSNPGADSFDPDTMADRNNPLEEQFSLGTTLGSIIDDFVYDAKLDPALFSLTPPEGFQIVAKPELALGEAELIEWLGSLAGVNRDTFPSAIEMRPDFDPTHVFEISAKKNRTGAEQKMYDLYAKYLRISVPGEHDVPVVRFVREKAVEGSFRYIGVGVKLGSADRLVCWYQSKSTGNYRAIYGDLTAKDVDPNDLPLPVSFSFAETANKIDAAQTITWTQTSYQRRTSKDRKRSWLIATRSDFAFGQPGLLRATQYDDEGNPRWIHIADLRTGKTLDFDLKVKKVAKGPVRYQKVIDPQGRSPFVQVANTLKRAPLELVGQRKINGKTVNVFRAHSGTSKTARSNDYWIDAHSKQLLGYTDVGADVFDPETDPDRDQPAEKEFSTGTMLGSVTSNIVFNATLAADLLILTPPAGYEIVNEPPPPPISEAEIIEWLGATARVNNGVFPAALKSRVGFEPTRWSEINQKKRRDWTEAEHRMYDLFVKYAKTGDQGMPVDRFIKENAVKDSFRYVGVGVKLGAADRIVCWYKLKTTDKYRVVFGDLTVRDVAPKDLPLPVDH